MVKENGGFEIVHENKTFERFYDFTKYQDLDANIEAKISSFEFSLKCVKIATKLLNKETKPLFKEKFGFENHDWTVLVATLGLWTIKILK